MKKPTESDTSVECQPPGNGYLEDPLDDPNFDLMAWVMTIDFCQPEPPVLNRGRFLENAQAAGFRNVQLVALGKAPLWEFRCVRGANADCATPDELERLLEIFARNCGWHLLPGQFLGNIDERSITAWFRMEPGPSPQ